MMGGLHIGLQASFAFNQESISSNSNNFTQNINIKLGRYFNTIIIGIGSC